MIYRLEYASLKRIHEKFLNKLGMKHYWQFPEWDHNFYTFRLFDSKNAKYRTNKQ